jgi:hypothetical protein
MNLSSVIREKGKFSVTLEDGDKKVSQSFDDYGNDTLSVFRFIFSIRKTAHELTGVEADISDPGLSVVEIDLAQQFRREAGLV